MDNFIEAFVNLELMDIDFIGQPFTLCKSIDAINNIKERLW